MNKLHTPHKCTNTRQKKSLHLKQTSLTRNYNKMCKGRAEKIRWPILIIILICGNIAQTFFFRLQKCTGLRGIGIWHKLSEMLYYKEDKFILQINSKFENSLSSFDLLESTCLKRNRYVQ